MTSESIAAGPKREVNRRRHRSGGLVTFLFALPMLGAFGVFAWWPLLRTVVMSFQHTNFISSTWSGLDNFVTIFSDPLLGQATLNTLYFALLAALFGFPIPLFAATLIAEMRRSRHVATVFVFMPVVVPPVVAILMWRVFYDPSSDGLFNSVLAAVHLGPVPWLQNAATVMPALVAMATWSAFGTGTIIFLAALMSINTGLYEAAEIDGASVVKRFWHITLPQLRTVILVLLLLQIIGTLQVFTEPYILTGGGPENETLTILLLIYNYAFVYGNYGAATALSLILAIALAIVSIVYLYLTRKWSRS